MVHQSSPRRILLTLSHGVVVPALSRRTGAPCRAVQTRWLVVEMNDTLRLVGCRDRKGRVFRTGRTRQSAAADAQRRQRPRAARRRRTRTGARRSHHAELRHDDGLDAVRLQVAPAR